ncbi:MAG: hypothetical protein KC656_23745, partial [Myxococcales bacterium]|nr:hypothetical protein [Myxococcales bacterium]
MFAADGSSVALFDERGLVLTHLDHLSWVLEIAGGQARTRAEDGFVTTVPFASTLLDAHFDGGLLYVQGGPTVGVFAAATGAVQRSVCLGCAGGEAIATGLLTVGPDGALVGAGSEAVQRFDAITGAVLGERIGEPWISDRIVAMAWSPDRSVLYVAAEASLDSFVTALAYPSLDVLWTRPDPGGGDTRVHAMVVDDAGHVITVEQIGTGPRELVVVDADGTLLDLPELRTGRALHLAYSPDGAALLALDGALGGGPGEGHPEGLRVFDADTGVLLHHRADPTMAAWDGTATLRILYREGLVAQTEVLDVWTGTSSFEP